MTNVREEWRASERERLRTYSGKSSATLSWKRRAPRSTVGRKPSYERTAPVLGGLVVWLGKPLTP